jgi:hypothetical protein
MERKNTVREEEEEKRRIESEWEETKNPQTLSKIRFCISGSLPKLTTKKAISHGAKLLGNGFTLRKSGANQGAKNNQKSGGNHTHWSRKGDCPVQKVE